MDIKPTLTVQAKDKTHLEELIQEAVKQHGPEVDLNFIDVNQIKDMSSVFKESDFNGDISKWNVSEVESTDGMFYDSSLNGDVGVWSLESVSEDSKKIQFLPTHGLGILSPTLDSTATADSNCSASYSVFTTPKLNIL